MFKLFILVNLMILAPIIIFGVIISFINKKVASNLRTKTKWWIYTLCGFIGTPVHELSHLIFHIIFRHKIKKVALYRPIESKKDGVLGFVEFSYNGKSLYQNIGLFFSGIGPMIGGCLSIYFLMKFMLPEAFENFKFFELSSLNFFEILSNLSNNVMNNIKCLYTNYESKGMLILFSILTFSISSHMSISTLDLKSAVNGAIILEVILIISSILLAYYNLTKFIFFIGIIFSYIISILMVGLIFGILSLIISYIISILPL